MFELIKILAETAIKAIPLKDILSRTHKSKIADIGIELFTLYASLNEIYVVGNGIVAEIQNLCRWMQRELSEGQSDAVLITDLNFLLSQQRVSLLKAVRSIKTLGLELSIIDGKSYAALVPLIHGKGNAVSDLLGTISSAPPELKVYDEKTLLAGMDVSRNATKAGPARLDMRNHPFLMVGTDELVKLTKSAQRLCVNETGLIKASRLPEFQAYLEAEKPAERLAELGRILENLRTALERNFSLTDILLKAGDKRAAITDESIGF
jgi:hypothetical protein